MTLDQTKPARKDRGSKSESLLVHHCLQRQAHHHDFFEYSTPTFIIYLSYSRAAESIASAASSSRDVRANIFQFAAATRWTEASVWDIDICQSRRVSGELLCLCRCDFTQTGFKFGYDQGFVLVLASSPFVRLLVARVMSGIITGPHFINFFDRPSALQVGTIVAVLEIGALGASKHTTYILQYLTLLK